MILVLTEAIDPTADQLIAMLEQRGADVMRFNTADFPERASVSLGYSSTGELRTLLRTDGKVVDIESIEAVWNRRPGAPVPHAGVDDPAAREFVRNECRTFCNDLFDATRCPWLPARPFAVQRASLKAAQLRLAAELGFELPPTLISNDPDEFLSFYDEHNGNVISKLSGFSFDAAVESRFVRYTEPVSKRDVGYVDSIRHCPMIFQAYIPKQVELRVTVVGKRVFAAEIHSQLTHHTRYDWRRYDSGQTPYLPHALPSEVQERCVRLVERLDLTYGAIDLILTPDDRYVFLEINPSGQYMWIEYETGLPITEAICDWLTNKEAAHE